jgi:CHAD domain-containing protein
MPRHENNEPLATGAIFPERPGLHMRMTVEQGFRCIVATCLAQIQDGRKILIQDDHPEALHQMRVGLRRLRCTLDSFRRVASLPVRMRRHLEWMSCAFGTARDWEVLCTTTLPAIVRKAPANPALPTVQGAAGKIAGDMRNQARTAASSLRFERCLATFFDWLEAGAWRRPSSKVKHDRLDASLLPFAEKCLRRDRRRLRKRIKKLDGTDPKARHKLRIAAKNARYAAEFFRPLYAKKAMERYINALIALQDELGSYNDMTVADKLLQNLDDMRPELHAGIGFARRKLKSRSVKKDHGLPCLWKNFKSAQSPWQS